MLSTSCSIHTCRQCMRYVCGMYAKYLDKLLANKNTRSIRSAATSTVLLTVLHTLQLKVSRLGSRPPRHSIPFHSSLLPNRPCKRSNLTGSTYKFTSTLAAGPFASDWFPPFKPHFHLFAGESIQICITYSRCKHWSSSLTYNSLSWDLIIISCSSSIDSMF